MMSMSSLHVRVIVPGHGVWRDAHAVVVHPTGTELLEETDHTRAAGLVTQSIHQ